MVVCDVRSYVTVKDKQAKLDELQHGRDGKSSPQFLTEQQARVRVVNRVELLKSIRHSLVLVYCMLEGASDHRVSLQTHPYIQLHPGITSFFVIRALFLLISSHLVELRSLEDHGRQYPP